jgi:hypothetical protein
MTKKYVYLGELFVLAPCLEYQLDILHNDVFLRNAIVLEIVPSQGLYWQYYKLAVFVHMILNILVCLRPNRTQNVIALSKKLAKLALTTR